jgi:hypothetical protein
MNYFFFKLGRVEGGIYGNMRIKSTILISLMVILGRWRGLF